MNNNSAESYDFVVIGGGMAGCSIAANLTAHGTVQLFEQEEQAGYHSTGRSAALFSERYGNDLVCALTRASRNAFFSPDQSFSPVTLVRPRDVMLIAAADQVALLDELVASSDGRQVRAISSDEALARCPVLRPESVARAAIITGTADIEVDALQQGYLRQIRAGGGVVSTTRAVVALERVGEGWRVDTAEGSIRARVVINAAGAWAGEIAALAGARNVNLRPLRRTACLVAPPPGAVVADWPMVVNIKEDFYLKPDAGMLLVSPADEIESEPGDAQPDDLDVAITIDRLERATTIEVKRVTHRWAGLRSFVADSSPVVGYDPLQPGFFWLAALGGFGIQTAPALGRIAADMVIGLPLAADLAAFGIDVAAMAPDRELVAPIGTHAIGVKRT